MSEATSRLHLHPHDQHIPSTPSWTSWSLYPAAKRSLDIMCVLVVAPLALIAIGLLALLVGLDGARPFFAQPRVGRGGREFTMWKLRTMVPDAEGRLHSYLDQNPAAKEEWTRAQKLVFDPRVTPIGRLLRKYSLDELPQLLNVLRGDMSLVGPRPMCPDQRAMYPGSEYFWLRPGITGLWQVSERNLCSFEDRAAYDRRYLEIMCFRADLQILWKTVAVVFRGTGL